MRCVNWNVCRRRTGSAQKKICWKKWRMCGECAVIYHPEAYTESYIRKIRTKIRQEGKRKIQNHENSKVLR